MKYLKYIIGALIVIVPCVLTVLIYNDKITENSPQYYKQGVEFYSKGDYSNAYYNFGKINKISPLYPVALYKQAKSAQSVGDYKMAALKYSSFLKKVPNSIFTTKATLNLGKSYYYSKQYDEAQSVFESLEKKTVSDATEEVYFLGVIAKQKGDYKNAYMYLKKYLYAALADEALNKSYILPAAEELSSFSKQLTESDKKVIGIAYFKNGKYAKALKYFAEIPMTTCWDYNVLANYYAGNKVVSKKLIESGMGTFDRNYDEDNLHAIYDVYVSYMTGSKLKNWTKMYSIAQANNLAGKDYVAYKLAGLLSPDKALSLYEEIVNNFPTSNYAAESLWNVFWNRYSNKNYSAAENLAIKHLTTYQKVKSTPKVMFWLAKTYEKEHKLSESHSMFNKLVSKYPDNYYGLRAASILDKKEDFWKTSMSEKVPPVKENIEFPLMLSNLDIKDLKLINTLFEIGDYDIWVDADFNNPVVESWFEFKKDKKTHSIVLVRDELENMEIKPPFASVTYKLAYPRYYVDDINSISRKNGLDPYLIMSLVREESYFNPSAKSEKNARGLMQLMPETAKYVIAMNGLDINSLKGPDDEETNLNLGCTYLKYLKDKFYNDVFVVAAYNGGEGAVTRWLKTYKFDDNDEFIENIPASETRNYVKKVFRSFNMYKKLYK